MSIITTVVETQLFDVSGNVRSNVRVTANLSKKQTDGAYVVPLERTFFTDVDGNLEMPLWPNSRGTGDSYYTISFAGISVVAFVPENGPVRLELIALPGPPEPSITEAEQILVEALQARADAIQAAEDAETVVAAAGRIFPDTASGIAATDEGAYFWVVSSDSTNVLELWLHDTGGTPVDTGKRTLDKSATVVSVPDIPTLLALEGVQDGQVFEVGGYHPGTNVGGGTLYWDAASTETANGGTVFEADAGGVGRFKRGDAVWVTPDMFGAAGDGTTDDSAFVQACVNASQKVRIIRSHLVREVSVPAECSIRGPGTIKRGLGARHALAVDGPGVTLSHLKFRPETEAGNDIWDVRLSENAHDCRISKCDFLTPSDSRIYSAIGTASEVSPEYPYDNPVKNLLVEGCTFDGYNRPIYVFFLENFQISKRNLFRNTWRDAIRIREACGNGLIDGNVFDGIGLSGDQTRDCVDTAWSGDKLIITNNICRNLDLHAFDIKGSPGTSSFPGYMSRHIVISDNIVEDCKRSAVVLVETESSEPDFIYGFNVCSNVFIRCNTDQAASDSNAAIQVERQVRYMNLSDNQIFQCFGSGISMRDAVTTAAGRVRDAIIKGNTIINCGSASSGGNGIRLNNVVGAVVTDNICSQDDALDNFGHQERGILIFGDDVGKQAIVRNNICRGNSVGQIVSTPQRLLSYGDNIEEGPAAYSGGGNAQRWKQPGRIFFSDTGALPTSGQFERGDWLIRKNPSGGTWPGRVCIASGEPGTWADMPALGLAVAAARADSEATDVSELVADFNDLLAKLRTAGLLAS